MTELLSKFIPIFLLLAAGYILRQKGLLTKHFVDDIKKLIVTLTLPSTLFLSFLTMELKSSYISLFAATIVYCFLLFFAGIMMKKAKLCVHPYSEFFYTGFEFGMVGVALFLSLFGAENLYAILLLGLGHELFIWFFYVPALQFRSEGNLKVGAVLASFFTSPIIIAIISAIILNASGIYESVASSEITGGIISALQMVAAMTSPLILLVIGFQLKFETSGLKKALKLIGLRLVFVWALGIAFMLFTDAFIMELTDLMKYAFITFIVLPPPFVIPVFLPKSAKEESLFYNNSLVIYTVITLILYMVIMLIIV